MNYSKGIILGTLLPRSLAELHEKFERDQRNDRITQFKKRRVIDEGNVFPTEPSLYGAFVPIPIVMRAFIFRVLISPELRAYLHICCYAFGFRTESVTGERIERDVGVSTRKAIYGPAKRLAELGFVLQAKKGFELNNPRSINWYQRPSLEYTLLKLLEAKAISSRLEPLTAAKLPSLSLRRDHARWHGEMVDSALKEMVGAERFAALEALRLEDHRRSYLIQAFTECVEARRLASQLKSEQRAKVRSKTKQPRAKRTKAPAV